jgi:fatty-acyl-CoA synthase
MNLGTWLIKRSFLTGDKISVVDGNVRLSFRELNNRVNAVANMFLKKGLEKGDRIAALLMNCHQFLEIYFAAAKLGLIMVPLNYRLTEQEIKFIVEDCDANLLVSSEEFEGLAKNLKRDLNKVRYNLIISETVPPDMESFEDLISSASVEEPAIRWNVSMEDDHLIMYSSGTTGRSKGSVYTHNTTFWHTMNMIERMTFYPGDKDLVFAPMFHCSTLNNTAIPTFYMGGALVIERKFEPREALDLIEKERINHTVAVPTLFSFMAEQPGFDKRDISSLRWFITGGAPCSVELLQIYLDRGIDVLQGYGLTEAAPVLLMLSADVALTKVGSAGKPVFYTDLRVVGNAGEDVKPGEVGEIIARGPNVIREYWHLPEETSKAIMDGWLYTGDMARVDEDGFVFIVERKKDMYISGGENVYPAEVEAILNQHPKIAGVGIIGVPDKKWTEVGKALIELRPGQTMDAEEVISFLQGKTAKYKMPRYVEFVKELPRNALGKLVKARLRAEYGQSGN